MVAFGEPVSVSCEAVRPVRVLGWESAISATHTQQELSVQWKVDSLIDWIEEPICYAVFFTAPRQCEEKLNLVLYSESCFISQSNSDLLRLFFPKRALLLFRNSRQRLHQAREPHWTHGGRKGVPAAL